MVLHLRLQNIQIELVTRISEIIIQGRKAQHPRQAQKKWHHTAQKIIFNPRRRRRNEPTKPTKEIGGKGNPRKPNNNNHKHNFRLGGKKNHQQNYTKGGNQQKGKGEGQKHQNKGEKNHILLIIANNNIAVLKSRWSDRNYEHQTNMTYNRWWTPKNIKMEQKNFTFHNKLSLYIKLPIGLGALLGIGPKSCIERPRPYQDLFIYLQ